MGKSATNRLAIRWIAAIALSVFALAIAPSLVAQEHDAPKDAHSESHGEIDPTHNFASPMLNNPMEWRADSAIFTLIVFLMLLAVLWAFAWKPINVGLEKRELAIANQIADAKKASEDAAATLREYQTKLAAAQAQAQEMVAQARKDAEDSGQRILAEARTEATRQRDRALAEIDSAKRVALNELAEHSTDIAMSLAQRIVGRELKAEDHQSLVQQTLAQLPSRN